MHVESAKPLLPPPSNMHAAVAAAATSFFGNEFAILDMTETTHEKRPRPFCSPSLSDLIKNGFYICTLSMRAENIFFS